MRWSPAGSAVVGCRSGQTGDKWSEGDLTFGGKCTVHYADDVLQSCTLFLQMYSTGFRVFLSHTYFCRWWSLFSIGKEAPQPVLGCSEFRYQGKWQVGVMTTFVWWPILIYKMHRHKMHSSWCSVPVIEVSRGQRDAWHLPMCWWMW